MKAPLLRTKLFRPAARAELVVRQRLLDRLSAGLSCKLMLVSAPAGYGKTTLISTWAGNAGMPVAWLSLDEYDNNPERFLAYLVAAVKSIGVYPDLDPLQPGFGSLPSFQAVPLEDIMPVLIDQLDSIAKPFVLVLDDYHAIKNPEIHKAVAFLIDYQPPQMHLAITTREDPPLPISRLRARGQLTELRQAELRFTPAETAAFLALWGSVELPSQNVAVLATRTEGWVAGLQMAALALQRVLSLPGDSVSNPEEISRVITSFGGGHEYIVDYFSAEVFGQLPEIVKKFLIQTSILEQLCGPLCEAVTGQTEGQQMLEYLQQANLFVIALDQERHWYRYHHLFRDLLRKQLQQQSAEILPELHRRASRWYEEHDMIDQAFEHAQAAGDQEKMGWIIDEYTEALWMRGEFNNLLHRIEALTPEQLEARGEMIIAKALIFLTLAKYDQAEQILTELNRTLTIQAGTEDQSGLRLGTNPVRQPGHLLGLVSAARAQLAVMRGDPQAVLSYARQSLDILAKYNLPWDIPWKCQILISMGDAYLLTGDIASAIGALVEAITLGRAYQHDALLLEALTKLAIAYRLQGNLNQAAQVCQEGLAHVSQHNIDDMPITAGLWITWGWIQTERDDLESAQEVLLKGLQLSRSSNQPTDEYFANTALLRYWFSRDNLENADACIHSAEMLAQKKKIPTWLDAILTGEKLLLWVRQGRLCEVEQALQDRAIHRSEEIVYPNQPLYYVLARLDMARADFAAALEVLAHLFKFAQAAGQTQWMLRVWIVRALIYLQLQNFSQALQALSMATELSAPEMNIQVFLDEGEPISRLLAEMLRRQPGSLFPQQLLQSFAQKALGEKTGRFSDPRYKADASVGHLDESHLPKNQSVLPAPEGENTRRASNMLEPLTERELEVLSLISEGLSNQQIASRLYLTVRTVKFHTSNIYCKLDVESRTEAVARARHLKLIT